MKNTFLGSAFLSLSPSDIIRKLILSEKTIEEALEKSRITFFIAAEMKELYEDTAFNEALIKGFAKKFYGSTETESQIHAASALNTEGARKFLEKQSKVAFYSGHWTFCLKKPFLSKN